MTMQTATIRTTCRATGRVIRPAPLPFAGGPTGDARPRRSHAPHRALAAALRLVCLLALIFAAMPRAGQAQQRSSFVLDNGMRAHHVQVAQAETATIALAWNVPAPTPLQSRLNRIALSALIDHGSAQMPAADVQILRQRIGGRVRVRAVGDALILTLTAPTAKLPALVRSVNLALRDLPPADSPWIGRNRLLFAIGERRAQLSLDAARNAILEHRVFGDSPGRDLAAAIEATPVDQIHRIMAGLIGQAPSVIVLASSEKTPGLRVALDKLLDGMTRHATPIAPFRTHPPFVPAGSPSLHRILVLDKTLVEPEMMLVAQTDIRGDRDLMALEMIRKVLGEGLASRLSLAIRRDLRASYDVSAFVTAPAGGGAILTMRGFVKPALLGDAIDAASRVYRQLRLQGVTLEEGRRAQIQIFNAVRGEASTDTARAAARELERLIGAIEAGDKRMSVVVRELRPNFVKEVARRLPPPRDLLVIVQSADPDALPGACVVPHVSLIEDCL